MSISLVISLLGSFQVTRAGTSVIGIESDRGRALLAYLAVEGDRPHRRDGLGALLWPDADDARMRQNLRRALYNLRQTFDLAEDNQPLLLVTPQDVQLNPRHDHQLDVAQFLALLEQCQRHAHPALETCATCNQQLAEAAALYRGDFLAGFSLPSSERFEEWRLFTQEALHVRLLETLTTLAAFHHARQEYSQAIVYLQRQIELEPWREEAHRALMRLFAARGERSAAMAQYALCTRLLNEELGTPPDAETDQLYEQILRGEISKGEISRGEIGRGEIGKNQEIQTKTLIASPLPSPISIVLPAPISPFIGRQRELTLIAQQLADPTCRLLTLVGLGGVGKTQLALSAAHALAPTRETATQPVISFSDGLYFVALGDLSAPSDPNTIHDEIDTLIASAIANVLGLELQNPARATPVGSCRGLSRWFYAPGRAAYHRSDAG